MMNYATMMNDTMDTINNATPSNTAASDFKKVAEDFINLAKQTIGPKIRDPELEAKISKYKEDNTHFRPLKLKQLKRSRLERT